MPIPSDYVSSDEYAERVYAGVLGKIIGVYLGRPFEGWSNERIERELGEVHYYVHEKYLKNFCRSLDRCRSFCYNDSSFRKTVCIDAYG